MPPYLNLKSTCFNERAVRFLPCLGIGRTALYHVGY
nr:MAG TPA: hypothetical protein [Caudoviricetes sp.]